MTEQHTAPDMFIRQLHDELSRFGPIKTDIFIQKSAAVYYGNKDRLGAEGDFTTAPEISQLFGEIIAAFLAYLESLSPTHETAILFEAGPGRGTLLSDMKRSFTSISPALDKADIHLLETSPLFQTLITDKIAQPVSFMSTLDDIPPHPLYGVANEFFDALGTSQIIFDGTDWRWRLVTASTDVQNPFCLESGAPLLAVDCPAYLPETPVAGTICEISPAAEDAMSLLARHIAQFGGGLLICDYGKSTNQGDTIQALRDHKPVPFLSAPGQSDITHLVDFAALKRCADNAGARLVGPVEQGSFLTELGIMERAERLRVTADPEGDRTLLAAIDRLISPAHMGGLFKVALLVPDGDGTPPGFASLCPQGIT
jgi:NADH dehydrogenase [ubiquinone] 1 alpha subcomplex assembly factor 7